MKYKSHEETIECPTCEQVQTAKVFHTSPYWTYIHECLSCKYLIMESEWNKVEDNKMKTKREKIIAVDFDGTCVTHSFPEIGEDVILAVESLKFLTVIHGIKLILWTCRGGKHLDAAVKWFQDRGIELWGINENPDQKAWSNSPKVYADFYVDDKSVNIPTMPQNKHYRVVSWPDIITQLYNYGFFEDHYPLTEIITDTDA